MCVNAGTSMAAFLIGTAMNALVLGSKKTDVLVIALIYEFILTMQLVDYVAWRNPKCGKINEFATKAGFVQNMLQPVVVLLILLLFTESQSRGLKGFASLLLVFYVGYVFVKLYYTKHPAAITCLKPTDTCKHLQYDWWWNIGDYPIFVHLTPIILGFLLLLNSATFALQHSAYLVLSFLISGKFYGCGVPSMFCLFAVGGPILNFFLS
jgi:hypothetical protein